MEAFLSTSQAVASSVINLSWEDVYERLKKAPEGRLFGVPRGGAIVAGLTGRAVSDISRASAIVDDIVDSGTTRQRYSGSGLPFWSLVDKTKEGIRHWVRFPWEEVESNNDLAETVLRQLQILGEDVGRDGLKETPSRVAKSLRELTEGYQQDAALILSKVFEVDYDEMVVLNGIEFWSLCEHHLLPFHGTASVGYIPNGKVVGISKLARLVHCYSRRLQLQEKLTSQIAHAIDDTLKPQGVGVLIKATHLCMALRGVKTPANMVTSCLLGAMRNEPETRSEFLKLSNE
jgi:GTP cyclohydrolase I